MLVMDDDANPRVQTHGAAALVNFTEECPKSILLLYIDAIMDKLERVLSNKMKEVCYNFLCKKSESKYICFANVC